MAYQVNSAATFTRPANATAYVSGQLVANSTAATAVTPLTFIDSQFVAGASGVVRRCRIIKSSTTTTGASFRLHLYDAQPTVANGDGGIWSSSPAANYVGAVDCTIDKAFTDGAVGLGLPLAGSECIYRANSGKLYGLLEARGAYTPGNAETFTVRLELMTPDY